jgi:hypothetical protein
MASRENVSRETLPFFQNPESIGMEKICNVIDKIYDCNDGFSSMIMKMFKGCLKIATYFGVYVLFKNCEKIWKPIKMFILKLVYNRLVLQKNNEHTIVEKFKKMIPPIKKDEENNNEIWVSGLPLYLEKEGNDYVIYNFHWLHSQLIKEFYEDVQQINFEITCKDENGKLFTPFEMFASDNYIKVDAITTRYFETFEATKMITPPILFINSPAGYGKTNVIHYLSRKSQENPAKEIRLIDLTSPNMINKGFSSIVHDLTVGKDFQVPIIIAFDELDKYVSLYTQHVFTSSQKGIKKDSTNMDEVVDNDFRVFERHVKLSVISTIGRLDSVKNFHKGVVWMFFSNNIHTIFQNLDQTHINSVKTRFTFIEFKKCNRNELQRYLTSFNEKLKNPKTKYESVKLRSVLRKIKMDIEVTFREIQICMNKAAYDIEKTIEYLNEGIYNPLLDYNGEEDIVPKYISSPSSSTQPLENVMLNFENEKLNVQKYREKKKEKKEIIIDMMNIVCDIDSEEVKELKLSEDELISKLKDLGNGYNLIKLAEMIIKYKKRNYNLFKWYYDHDCVVLVDYLLSIGVDPNIVIGSNPPIFRLASERLSRYRGYNYGDSISNDMIEKYEEMVFVFLKYNANLGKKYENIIEACETSPKILKYLIDEKGIDVTSENFYSNLKFKWGNFDDYKKIMELILTETNFMKIFSRHLEFVEYFNSNYPTILEFHYNVINYFLDKGADVGQYISKGFSPIYIIIKSDCLNVDQKEKIVRRMIDMGGAAIKLRKGFVGNKEKFQEYKQDEDLRPIFDLLPDSVFNE